ncbi:MAG: ATP-binding cassette domain-containing protein [Treponema sp.]|jgi:ABC-2 type transport system ATP-binding protein|nr:ATP-binding cassette domain-containing protein [Treponema sp.]
MIEVRGLVKRYGTVEAVRGVSFSVGAGEILGFLGPNGAGKTTIMRLLTGFHFPGGGAVLVDGISVEEDPVEVKRRIGYLPETAPLYGELTVNEYLDFIARARRVPGPERGRAVGAAVDACGLGEVRSKRIETLSKGYRQRTGLAQAILHDPPILILDEPTSGLDPNQIIGIRGLIRELGRRKTVILSTHILQEVEAVADRVLILNEGKIAAQGTPEEIAGTMKGGDTWELVLKGADRRAVAEKLSRLGVDTGAVRFGEGPEGAVTVSLFIPGGLAGERLFDWAVAEGLKLLGMNRRKLSLEDIFVKLTGDEGGQSPADGQAAGVPPAGGEGAGKTGEAQP